MKWWQTVVGAVMLVVVGWGLRKTYFWQRVPILSPLGKILGEEDVRDDYRIVGFLPTWMIGKTQDYCEELSELVFLGVEIDPKGELIWDGQSRKLYGDDYIQLKKRIRECGGKNILGVKLFKDEKIDELVNNPEAVDRLVGEIKAVVDEEGFDGVNVDIEYQGNPTAVLEDPFLNFLEKVKAGEVGEVSLDVFANTIIRGNNDRLNTLLGMVDYVLVMAYDFHRPGMDYAGPVAPIEAGPGERNIMEVVEKVISSNLDKEKIVMAYPLYGYEWETYGEEYGARTGATCVMASYNRVEELLSEGVEVKKAWDEVSMTPWLSYKNEGRTYQIYYDDIDSLKIKYDLVVQNQLGGVGFWALGYEGERREVWEEMKRVLE